MDDSIHFDDSSQFDDSIRQNPSANGGIAGSFLTVNWIEAKLFYGAASITLDPENATAKSSPLTRDRMNKYTKSYFELYGPGAIVFYHGFSAGMADALGDLVLALDASPLDVSALEAFTKPAEPPSVAHSGNP